MRKRRRNFERNLFRSSRRTRRRSREDKIAFENFGCVSRVALPDGSDPPQDADAVWAGPTLGGGTHVGGRDAAIGRLELLHISGWPDDLCWRNAVLRRANASKVWNAFQESAK